jgi:hypothetical protein
VTIERFDCRLEVEDDGFPALFGFVTSADVFVNCCRQGDFGFGGCSHDGIVTSMLAQSIGGEEFTVDIQCSNIICNGKGFFFSAGSDNIPNCQRIHLSNALLNGHGNPQGNCGVLFVEGSFISNVIMMNPTTSHTLFLGDDNITLDNVSMEMPLVINGKNARLNNIRAPRVEWWDQASFGPSSGVMLSPLLPDPDKVYDLTQPARWQRALLVDRDGKVQAPGYESQSPLNPPDFKNPGIVLPSPKASAVPLTIEAADDQTADLQQWKDEPPAVALRVSKSGYLVIKKTAAPD